MAEFIQPFDFKAILIDYLLGSGELFAFAFLIVFSFACARYGMSNRIYLILLAISSLIMGFWLGEAIYVIMMILIGFMLFKGWSRIFT